MTIYQIINKYNDSEVEKVVLDYEGDIEEFGSIFDIPHEIQDEEAKSSFKNGILEIIVRS